MFLMTMEENSKRKLTCTFSEQKRANYDRYVNPKFLSIWFWRRLYGYVRYFGGGFGALEISLTFLWQPWRRGAARCAARGSDMGIRLSITLEEAAAGILKIPRITDFLPAMTVTAPCLGEGGKLKTVHAVTVQVQ